MKMRSVLIPLVVVSLALAPAGCARNAPILNLEAVPVATASGKALTPPQVRSAIIAGATSLGWRVADSGPGKLEATLNLRTHMAVVDIPYSASSYSILYKRSAQLDESDGRIHSNYNGWVQNLDRAIRTELARL
jgi:hypothetical protein